MTPGNSRTSAIQRPSASCSSSTVRTMAKLTGLAKLGNASSRLGPRQVMVCLEVYPELRCGPEGLRKQPGSLRCDPSLPPDNLVDTLHRHSDMLGQPHLSQPKRLQVLLLQNLSGMGWDSARESNSCHR